MDHTALHKAVKHGDAISVRRLLSSGCDPNERWGGAETSTPLSFAAARGDTPILQMLLDAGATPTWYALQIAAFGNHAKAVRLLLAAGAPVDAGDGHTPLLNALKWSGVSREQSRRVRDLLREAGGRELPDWYLRWRWTIRYGWRWRLRRMFHSLRGRQKQR
jgi:hypothetical protein